MADNNDDILSQFAEFMEAKKQSEAENAASEDYDVEIWDEKGRGARVKRSHAKPFLQSLGIDLDPDPEPDNSGGDGKANSGTKSTGKTNKSSGNSAPTSGVARKYFVKPTGK